MALGFLLVVSASQAAAAIAAPPADASELNSVAKAVRAFVPKDEFDTPPGQRSVTGREFLIEVQPWGTKPPKVACFGYPQGFYSQESGTLYVSTGASKLVLSGFLTKQGIVTKKAAADIWPEEVHYFASDCARANLPSYTGTNAYGATFRIEPTEQTVTAIADSPPKESKLTESFQIKIGGAAARTLVPNLRVRFQGRLSDWKPGVSVACGRRRDGPTASSPYDRTLKLCLFNGRIEQIDLVDSRTGAVLQTVNR